MIVLVAWYRNRQLIGLLVTQDKLALHGIAVYIGMQVTIAYLHYCPDPYSSVQL